MEQNEIVIGVRVDRELHDRIVTEQERLQKETGINVTKNETVRVVLKKALPPKGKRK